MTTEKRSYNFTNGLTITGTLEQILDIAAKLGETVDATQLGIVPKGYYQSETKGLIRISDMNEIHIINALTKRTIGYYESIRPKKGEAKIDVKELIKDYLTKFVALTDDLQIEELYSELVNRTK